MTAAVFKTLRPKSISRRRWLLRGSLAAVVALLLAALACYLFPQQVLTVDSGPVKADVMVVLGGGLRERPERAAELFKAGEAPLIICAGNGDAEANQTCLTNAGVSVTNIWLEPKSRTTRENAKFTIARLRAQHLKSAIIVTSWYHSRRALVCFEHYAPDIKFYSRPSYFGYSREQWRPKGISGYVKSEYLKLLGYWVRYGVCPL
jgi:uncharacterized SAM-binding protein YcdF (DUF218 family)